MVGVISLDGTWDFLYAGSGEATPVKIRQAVVPGPWQAQFADLRMKSGTGIYRRRFDVPRGWRRGRAHLRFGAVFHNARVWVNGAFVGSNEGGFLPFSFDVSESLREGANEIKVRVETPTDDATTHPDGPLAEIPFGKQSWYGPLSGIWQSVYLECRDADHVRDVRLQPKLDDGTLALRVLLAARATTSLEAELQVLDPAGMQVASARVAIAAGSEETEPPPMAVPSVRAWSPDTPNLYTLRIALVRAGDVVDTFSRTFGFRTFEARGGRFYLNGKPFHLRGALDQDYYPDTICTLPSVAFAEDQFRKAKALGLNCIRTHIKTADPRYLDAADRVGILIWAELPNGGLSTERSRARKTALLKGMVDRDAHHPSIVIWTIINENWGVDLVHDASHRAWLKRTFDWLKDYDPTRLVVDNSPLHPSFHVKTDIADYHFYAAIPDSRRNWDRFVDDLAARRDFLFSPEDGEPTGREPVLCSEFGNWGLPDPNLLAGPDGTEPWWFETGHDWGEGVMYPHGIEHRFSHWHLDRVFGSLGALVEQTQWQQYAALRYQIERMRLKPELAGYVITELTDVHWEANGLLDMRRNPRVFHDVFRHINADTVIIPGLERWSYWTDETPGFPVTIAHAGTEEIEHGELAVQIESGETVRIGLPRIEAGVSLRHDVRIALPKLHSPRQLKLELVLRDAGHEVARNWIHLAVHPARGRSNHARLWTPDASLAERLAKLGYQLAPSAEAAELIVARDHDEELAASVRAGKHLLLLADEPMPLYPFFPHWQNVNVEARSGTPWQGDWASSFCWLDRRSAFAGVPGGSLLDLAFDRVMPRHVVSGLNRLDFQGRVHAGLVVGWVHKPVGLVAERGYGKGRVVATTFRLLEDAPSVDPTATVLLDRLITLGLARNTAAALAPAKERPADAPDEAEIDFPALASG